MKVFKAIARLITHPLSIALICLSGYTIYWYLSQPRGADTGRRTVTATRSGALGRASRTATKIIEASKKSAAPARIAAVSTTKATREKARDRADGGVKHFEAENEPPETAALATAPKSPDRVADGIGAPSAPVLTVDVIGPNDPRASALNDYQTKKAAIPDTAAANQELALWCDQHGLWDAAKTQWEAVRRLDPKSEEAQKRLGYRRLRSARQLAGPARLSYA